MIAATFLGGRKAVEFLSSSLIAQTISQTEAELHRFFDPVLGLLDVTRTWGRAGDLDVDEPDSARRLLTPLLAANRQVSSALVADTRGHEVMILQLRDGWRSRETRPEEWGRRTRWVEWGGDGQAEPVVSWLELDYDPRRRPWYLGASHRHRGRKPPGESDSDIHWTRPYTFFTTKDPGITASAVFSAPSGRDTVVGFDVSLSDISDFTSSLKVGEQGGVMVLTDEGRVIGLPGHERFHEPAARRAALLKRLDELNWTLASDARRAFAEQAQGRSDPVRFSSGDTAWWGQRKLFPLGTERRLWITVVVPESDLLGNLRRMPLVILVVALVVIGISAWRALMVAHRFSRPIEALVRESDRIRRGDFEQGAPIVSSVKEVRRLARAHERMRTGLESLMKLERDLHLARQIQAATLPARLPPVPGFEIDAWSEPAEETGGDTYDVVGYRRTSADGVVLTTDDAERAVLLVADATGHGIGPALSATEVRAMLRMAVRTGEALAQIARHVNEQLCADLGGGRFITAWLAELDGKDHTLLSFSAGQAPVLYYRAATGTVEVVGADAPPLGILPGMEIQLKEPLTMEPGDIVAVISDGVFEAMNERGQQFGLERAIEVLARTCRTSANDIMASLKRALSAFTAGRAAGDDRTAIVIKRI